MTILYTDLRHKQRVDVDAIAPLILDICNQYLMIQCWFDIVHIDLRGDVEAVEFFSTWNKAHVAGLGGASAWKVYERLAEHIPEINHHFRQPPSPPPPNVLFPTS